LDQKIDYPKIAQKRGPFLGQKNTFGPFSAKFWDLKTYFSTQGLITQALGPGVF